MEAPPLIVPADLRRLNTVPDIFAAGPVLGTGLLIYNTIAFYMEMPEVAKRGEKISQSLQEIMNAEGIWIPTLALANETGLILSAHGFSTDIAEIKPISDVQNRSYTVFMENWLSHIRAWYNKDAVIDYREFSPNQSTLILEVGIINYELVDNKLLLQVMMKMIEPSNGIVIGRTRASDPLNLPQIGPSIDQAFEDDAKLFKAVFTNMGENLIGKCLIDLGLIPQ